MLLSVWFSRSFLAISLLLSPSALFAKPGEGFQVEFYQLNLRPNIETGIISGSQTILIEAKSDDLQSVSFSPNALQITDATAGGHDATVSSDAD